MYSDGTGGQRSHNYDRTAHASDHDPTHSIRGPGDKSSALWEGIRYGGGRVRYQDSEIDFEDTKYDPVQPR